MYQKSYFPCSSCITLMHIITHESRGLKDTIISQPQYHNRVIFPSHLVYWYSIFSPVSARISMSCFKCLLNPQVSFCPDFFVLDDPWAYQKESYWELPWMYPGSDTMWWALFVCYPMPHLLLWPDHMASTRPVNHPTRVLKMCNVRTSEISQEPFSSCCSNCTIFSENWKKWDFLLFLCRSQTLRTIGAVPILPLWTARFFSSGEIWLLAPFSSKHTPSHRANKIIYSYCFKFRYLWPTAIYLSSVSCLLRPSFFFPFGV